MSKGFDTTPAKPAQYFHLIKAKKIPLKSHQRFKVSGASPS